jgi:hypothetical protein
MQPIDPHTLFSIFEQGDEQIYEEHGLQDTLNNPYVLMGMVVKGVENYFMMDLMYMQRYPKEYTNVRNVTKRKYFNRLYSYLERIDSDNFGDEFNIGESFEKGEAFLSLDYLRIYFEKVEHYEKCAVVKKYQDLLNKRVGELI